VGKQVFANNREIAYKRADGKSICAFPDVCFTPPQTPATPPGVPIPYPNTGFACDTSSGSSSVQIGSQEIMLKDQSQFKKSMGDEAGCAPKKGLVNSKISGKVQFVSWSMDVKIEGHNVPRHFDLMTHNHGSNANEAITWPYIDKMAVSSLAGNSSCGKEAEEVRKKCGEDKADPCPGILNKDIAGIRRKIKKVRSSRGILNDSATKVLANSATMNAQGRGGSCVRAMRCLLRPYSAKPRDGITGCCPGQTPHHIPPWSTIKSVGSKVTHNSALCICLEGAGHSVGSHGKHHHGINYLLDATSGSESITKLESEKGTFFEAPLKKHVEVSAAVTEAQTGCSKECIQQQLEKQFGEENLAKTATHNASSTGGTKHTLMDDTDKARAIDAYKQPPGFESPLL
jgi:hypothetical protein